MNKVKFVVISYQRTGSTFLVLTLNELDGVICHSELFNPGKDAFTNSIFDKNIYQDLNLFDKLFNKKKEDKLFILKNRNPEKFLRRIYNQNAQAVGFKIFPGQNDLILDTLIFDRSVKKILLERKNLLRSYVSKKIAENTGLWSQSKDKEVILKKTEVDIDRFFAYSNMIDEGMNSIREKLTGTKQQVLELTYEEITTTFPLKKLTQFLEIENAKHIPEVNQKKQNPFPLSEMILNYDELSEHLNNTEYEKYLFD